MPVDTSFIGRVYPPTEPYLVSREKIREFVEATNDPNPIYRDPAAAQALGYPDVIAPPTFAVRLTLTAGYQLSFDPAFGLDYSRVVHGEQRFEYQRPLRAGDVVQVVVSVENIRVAAGNEIITTRSDLNTTDGEHVLTALATIVARGTAA